MTQLISERESDARALCAAVKLSITALEVTPRHVICAVAPDPRQPASIVIALYREMARADMPLYAVSYSNEPFKGISTWLFGKAIS